MRPIALALLLSSLLAGCAFAADVDLSGFDKVLLPLDPTIRVAGANGAQFETVLRIAPSGPIRFYPSGLNTVDSSIGTFAPGPLQPGSNIAPQIPASASGRLLFIEKGKYDDLHPQFWMVTRPADTADYQSLWTSIPIVRERDFRTGTIVFPQVESPWVYLDPEAVVRTPYAQFRYLLRLYDVDNRGDVEVRVKVDDLQFLTPVPHSEQVVKLNTRRGTDASQPYVAELPIEPLCHPFSSHTPCANATMRITIEPLTPGARYWAMLSLTNNFTQDVTLFWPQ
jgi:hypothetical protein